MAFDVDVQYFRQRASLLIKGLSARFGEFGARDFPSNSPLELIALVRAILDLLLKKTEAADEKLLSLMFPLLYEYQSILQFVDNAHTDQTPTGLVSVMKDLLEKVSPGSRFFASPQAEYNYTIRDLTPGIVTPLSNLLSPVEMASLPASASVPFHLITFPRAERDNIMIHAVFGHEVGHILAGKYLDQEALTPEYSAAFQDKVGKANVFYPVDPTWPLADQFRHRAQLSQTIAYARKRALEELLSDYVGILIFGPSCLFALYDILSLDDLDAFPEQHSYYYPPNRYRLRRALSALMEEGFLDEVNRLAQSNDYFNGASRLIQRIESVTNKIDDEGVLASDPLINVIYEWVGESIEAAKAAIKALVPGELLYSAVSFQAEVPELIERISVGVPPNELGIYPAITLPSWQSALASVWCVKIHGQKSVESGKVEALTPDECGLINLFGLRAVENIALGREYQSKAAGTA